MESGGAWSFDSRFQIQALRHPTEYCFIKMGSPDVSYDLPVANSEQTPLPIKDALDGCGNGDTEEIG